MLLAAALAACATTRSPAPAAEGPPLLQLPLTATPLTGAVKALYLQARGTPKPKDERKGGGLVASLRARLRRSE